MRADTSWGAAPSPPFWRGKLPWLAGLLLLGISCEREAPVTPPEPGEPPAAEVEPADTSAAYAGHESPGEEEEQLRKRPEAREVKSRDEALEAVASGNAEGAIEFLRPHVEADAKDIDARLALSRALAYVGQVAAAQKLLTAAEGAPDDPGITLRRLTLLWRMGKAKEAMVLATQAAAKFPKDLPLRGELLVLMHRTGKGDTPEAEAIMDSLYDAYDDGSAQSTLDLIAVAQAALSRGKTGGFKDANMVLQDAEDQSPATQGTWAAERVILLRGATFLEKYAHRDATETYRLMLERDPWHPQALVGMSRVYVDSLQFALASRTAMEALQVSPGDPGAHAVLARIAVIEGRREEARDRIHEHVLAVNAHHLQGLAVLASLALLEDDASAYEKWRNRALDLNPKNGEFYKDLADILGFLHLYPEADNILEEGARLAPDDAYVQAALGLNRLRIGKETEGRAALSSAWRGDKFNERTRNTLDLYQDVIDKKYKDSKHGDLTVRLPEVDRDFLVDGLVESIERSRRDLDKAYATKAGALQLEFYADPQAFSIRTVGVPSLGALAVCFGPVITFVGPYHGMYNIDMVVRHEMAHVYAISKSRGRVPRWFTEGLSEWESEVEDPAWARESAELLSQARAAGKLRRLSELELAFIRAESGMMMEVAYATSAYAMRYLGRTYGREKLVAILEGYGKGEHTEALFDKHLGKKLGKVEREFETWFFAELDAKVSGWEPTSDGEGDERDIKLRDAMEQVSENDMQEAARLLEELIAADGDGYTPRLLLARVLLEGPKPGAAKRHLVAARKFHTEAIEPLVLLANLAREQGDVAAEKKHLAEALTIDGDSLEPAARLLMLGVVTDDAARRKVALARVRAIAPLHPIALAAQSLSAAKKNETKARKFLLRALRDLQPGQGPSDTFVIAALAAHAVGESGDAKSLAEAARKDPKLPAPAKAKLTGL